MMITHYDFLAMTETAQYQAVWSGTFLGERREDKVWVQYYSLGSFYVEIYYDAAANRLQDIRSFTRIEQLGSPSALANNRNI